MKHGFIVLLMLLALGNASAINHKTDSLNALLAVEKRPLVRANLLVKIGLEYDKAGNQAAALRLFKNAQTIGADLKSDSTLAYANFMELRSYYYTEKFDSAVPVINRLFNRYAFLPNKRMQIQYFIMQAEMYSNAGLATDGIKAADRAIALSQQFGLTDMEAISLVKAAMIYGYVGNRNKVLELYQKALILAKQTGNSSAELAVLSNMGDIYYNNRQFEKALECQNKALVLAQKNSINKKGLPSVLASLAMAYHGAKMHEKSWQVAAEAIAESHRQKSNTSLAVIYRNLANWKLEDKKYYEALNFNDSTQKYDHLNGIRFQSPENLAQRSEILKKMGRYKEALEANEKHNILKDSIYGEKNRKEIQAWEQRMNIKERELATVKLAENLKAEKLKSYILYLLVVVLSLGIFMLWKSRRNHNRKIAQQKITDALLLEKVELELSNEKLKLLALESEKALLDEKKKQIETELAYKNKVLVTVTAFSVRKSEILTKLKEALPKGNNVPDELKTIIATIDESLETENDWDNFKLHFENVHPHFFTSLLEIAPDLTAYDLKMAAYLKMNLGTKQIGRLLQIGEPSVRNARYRLRSKLGLEYEDHLASFLAKLN